jgi:prophage regulatory protein
LSENELDRFMRLGAVKEATGLSESSIHDLRSRSEFPEPVPLPGRRVAWLRSEIAEWQRTRIAERDRKKTEGAA